MNSRSLIGKAYLGAGLVLLLGSHVFAAEAGNLESHVIGSAFQVALVVMAGFVGISLVRNGRRGWGWVVVGLLLILILLVTQFGWAVITAFRGDPAGDEDYFAPLESWTSDSF